MYKRKGFSVIFLGMMTLSLVIVIALVYAAFTGQLQISSGGGVSRISKWDIHFENLSSITTTGSAKVLKNPTLTNGTTIDDYDISVTSPNDTIYFTVDVVNEGNYNAKITQVDVSTPECTGEDSISNSNVCNHLHYSLTYDSGASVQVGDTLYAKEVNTMKIALNYDDTVTAEELPTSEVTISNLEISIQFEQDSSALVKDNGEVADYKVYKQGRKITLNNEDYYVIANSGADKDYVVALKDTPLTVDEMNLYGGVGTENNHVNKYTNVFIGQVIPQSNGTGAMAYYTSETCGNGNGVNTFSGCLSNYETSDVKYVIDAWEEDKFQSNELKEVDGYSTRLIKKEEYQNIPTTYSWKYSTYWYWTMSMNSPNTSNVVIVTTNGISTYNTANPGGQVRPVINVYKSALES